MSGNSVQGDEMREELPFGQTASVVNGVVSPMVDGTTPLTTEHWVIGMTQHGHITHSVQQRRDAVAHTVLSPSSNTQCLQRF